jgi:hypothetical protein
MKAAKSGATVEAPFKIWCEYCSIRIAPNEERVSLRDKTYHASCHSKVARVPKAKV